MNKSYQLPLSKSDDLLLHFQQQQSPLKIREGSMRKSSMHHFPMIGSTEPAQFERGPNKRLSFHSLCNVVDQNATRSLNLKKKVLSQIASMGLNVYMAEYVIGKQGLELKIDANKDHKKELERLVNVILEKIEEIEQEQKEYSRSSCKLKKEALYRYSKPTKTQVLPAVEEQILELMPVIGDVAPNSQTISCNICQCEIDDPLEVLKCKHKFCKMCLIQYLNLKIDEARVLEIYCPQENCKCMFDEDNLKILLTKEKLAKYEEFRQKKLLEQDETVRWCVRPGCDKHVRGNIFSKVVVCACGQGICYDCRREEHNGLSCEAAFDKYYEQMLKSLIIQKCPKCKAPIQKKEGCNHMTCYQCRFQFCWICRARYTRMHFDSDNCFGCPDKQFSTDEPSSRPRWKKYGGILFELFASILMVPLLPVILMYYAILGPLKLLKKFNRRAYKNISDEEYLGLLFLGVVLSPVLMALLIFPGSILLLCYKLRYD